MKCRTVTSEFGRGCSGSTSKLQRNGSFVRNEPTSRDKNIGTEATQFRIAAEHDRKQKEMKQRLPSWKRSPKCQWNEEV